MIEKEMIRDLAKKSCDALKRALDECDKSHTEVFEEIGISKSMASQILDADNDKNLQAHCVPAFCKAVGNTIYMDFLNENTGCINPNCDQSATYRAEIKELQSQIKDYERLLMEIYRDKQITIAELMQVCNRRQKDSETFYKTIEEKIINKYLDK